MLRNSSWLGPSRNAASLIQQQGHTYASKHSGFKTASIVARIVAEVVPSDCLVLLRWQTGDARQGLFCRYSIRLEKELSPDPISECL